MAPAVAPPRVGPADNAQALRKQRAAVEAIAADNMKLKEELMLENKFSVNPTTQTAAALIANLQEQADVYAAKVRSGGAVGADSIESAGPGYTATEAGLCVTSVCGGCPATLLSSSGAHACRPPPTSSLPHQITEEQRLKAELEAQVEGLRARIAEQRVQMGGMNNSAEQAIKVRAAGQGWLAA